MRNFLQFVLSFTRAVAFERSARRRVMGGLVVLASFLLFCGAVPLSPWLEESPWRFILYWILCAWIVICLALLAIYDLLRVLADGRTERQELKKKMFGDHERK